MKMYKITVQIDGMMCGMCESHMDDGFRNEFSFIKKVTSSHSDKSSVIITPEDISDDKLKETVEKTGYKFISAKREPYEKKGLFSFGVK